MLDIALRTIAGINWLKHKECPIPTLYFHRVLSEETPYCPDDWTIQSFTELLSKLNQHFSIIPLSKALILQQDKKLPRNPLCLTFDDGYLDNFTNAAPILDNFNIKASFFIATSGVKNGHLWNDKLQHTLAMTNALKLEFLNTSYSLKSESLKAAAYLDLVGRLKVQPNAVRDEYLQSIIVSLGHFNPPRCMMTSSHLCELQLKGHDIGAHTHTHSILGFQNDDVAKQEMHLSISILNNLLPEPITLFAYPNGTLNIDFNAAHEAMLIKEGIKYGVSTNDGGITLKTVTTRLPRFMPHRKQLIQFCLAVQKIAGE